MSLEMIAIRRRIAARLKGATLAGDNVFRSRVLPLQPAELPALLVVPGDIDIEEYNEAPRSDLRRAQVWLEACGDVSSPALDDLLDFIVGQVEYVLAQDDLLGGLVNKMRPAYVASVDPSETSRYAYAARRLRVDLEYFVDASDRSSPPDLAAASVDWDLAEPDGVLEAEDEINL